MPFSIQNWGRVSVSANEPITTLQDLSVIGAPRVYSYISADTQVAIGASGYFNDGVPNQGVAPDLVTGDIIIVESSEDGTVVFNSVTNTDGVITIANFNGSAPVGTADITNNAVTFAKIQEIATHTLLGNPTAGTTEVSEVTLGAGLAFSGTTLTVAPTVGASAAVTMTAAEWNGMFAAPKQIVAAPGANLMLVVDSVVVEANFGTTQYAGGGAAALQYSNTVNGAGTLATASVAAAAVNGIAADSTFRLLAASIAVVANALVVNQGLFMSNLTGAFTTGNSPMTVTVNYHTIAVAP
jgi:Repeat of unknown function (DUF5907)